MDYQLQSSRFHKESVFTSEGIIGENDGHKLYGESHLVVDLQNVKSSNVILLEGRLHGSLIWHEIGTIKGNILYHKFNIKGYDYIRFQCLILDRTSTSKLPKLIASGFFVESDDDDNIVAELKDIKLEMKNLSNSICKLIDLQKSMLTHLELINDEEV